MTRQQRIVGIALAVLTTIVVLVNHRGVGLARDELVYMSSGSKYADWWSGLPFGDSGFSRKSITSTFGGKGATDNNREHPALMKTVFGFSEKLLHDKLGVAGETTAYRLPTALMHGLLVLLVYFMVVVLWGFTEAIVSALLVLFLPRALFHAGLACFDAPIATLWFATVYTYWRCMDGRRWPWQVGVVFGLALATKHNALLLPFALGTHYLYVGVTTMRANRIASWPTILHHRWRVIASLGVLGPLALIAVWPWLWLDPIGHATDWITFHLKHVHYNFEYLGHNWNAPRFPWHTALVTTLLTVPVVTLVAAVTGVGAWFVRRKETADTRAPAVLLVLSAAASIGPFFLGTTPIFGAEKHWMPALPTICIAAGVGVVWVARQAVIVIETRLPLAPRHVNAIVAVVASVVVLAAAVETFTAQPYALSSYNALAGGSPGGADLGMNRQFWGVSARGVLPELPKLLPGGGSVYSHDASPAWGAYMKQGLLPKTFPDSGWEQMGVDRSRLALVIHERHFNRHDYLIWKAYGTVAPVFVLRAHGVPIVSVYRRP